MAKKAWEPPMKIEELYERVWHRPGNLPTAGAQNEKPVPRGTKPFQLYSVATPNGQKIGIMLEELGIEYDAHITNLGRGEQFDSGFVAVNPNSKIPCAVDYAPKDGGPPLSLFESVGIMVYLADKHGTFIAKEGTSHRAEQMNWLFWQMAGQGPMTGNFGQWFANYAPKELLEEHEYGSVRYGMEVQRLCSVLDKHLADRRKFIMGEEYTIVDMALLPWFQVLRVPATYTAANGVSAKGFLSVDDHYKHACAWADRVMERPQVQRGMIVCRGKGKPWLEGDKRFEHLAKL